MSDQTAIVEVHPEYRLGTIQAKSPHDVIVQATIIAKELATIVKERRLASNIQGREYVRVEGWSTMGAMLGVLPRETGHTRLDDGSYEAEVDLIRISDNAVIGHASARVGTDEKTWGSRPEYARLSMAITRATGKAYRLGFSWIMSLAGYEATPAEEMTDVIEGEYHPAPSPTQQKGNGKPKAEPINPDRPYSPEMLVQKLNRKATEYSGRETTEKQHGLFAGMIDLLVMGDEDKRKTILLQLFGVASRKDVLPEQVLAALDWLKPAKDSGGAFAPDPMATKEAEAVWTASLKEEGQQELL